MPDFYALQQQGVADGTVNPALRADARQVNGKETVIIASKPGTQALAAGDRLYLGRLRAGDNLRRIFLNTDTSFGTSTIAIGTTANPTKYVAATTFTAPLNTPTSLPVRASTADDGPLTADEDIWATVAVATIGAAVLATFDLVVASNN